MIRRMDEVGRVTIPEEYRKKLGIAANNKLNITFENNALIISKAANSCICCGKEGTFADEMTLYGKYICKNCCKKISDIYLSL